MAGLQYNFFPTDFFYPRPKAVAVQEANGSSGVVLPLPTPKTQVQAAADNLHGEVEPNKSLAQFCSINENNLLKPVNPQLHKETQITQLLVVDDDDDFYD